MQREAQTDSRIIRQKPEKPRNYRESIQDYTAVNSYSTHVVNEGLLQTPASSCSLYNVNTNQLLDYQGSVLNMVIAENSNSQPRDIGSSPPTYSLPASNESQQNTVWADIPAANVCQMCYVAYHAGTNSPLCRIRLPLVLDHQVRGTSSIDVFICYRCQQAQLTGPVVDMLRSAFVQYPISGPGPSDVLCE